MRFNSPPNWPAPPPGWSPSPDWQPDPSWPPPPPGWPLWVDDPPRNRKPIILGVIALGVVAIIATVLVLTLGGEPAQSDEEQVRAAVATLEDSFNRQDTEAYRAIHCRSRQTSKAVNPKGLHRETTIKSLKIDGDKATAQIETDWQHDELGPQPGTYELVRESDRWKVC
ncbi:MAG: hypothetical protein QOH57_4765 [Mycobacterium sp.]|jgi:hypothetical protein|nr:hypothetical protein [Mycobacterium sp.]